MRKYYFILIAFALFSCSKPKDVNNNTSGGTGSALYNFNGALGANPDGDLIISGSTLYGMTSAGGDSNYGTIFSININGTGFTKMHDFTGGLTDGETPYGDLLLSGNTLYGLTHEGGANYEGVLFSINTSGGGYQVLYNFATPYSGNQDKGGVYPNGSLIMSGTLLYGMTSEGGGALGNGNIFSFNTNGNVYTDIYDFTNGQGVSPGGNLVLSGNTFYGMAYLGGGSSNDGVVFSVSTTGTGYTTLVTFTGSNGANPQGSLLLSNGILYGTTSSGGANNDGNIFSVSTSGSGFKDLYDFNSTGPAAPYCTLIISGSTLYGTASSGANVGGYVYSIGTGGSGFTTLFAFNLGTNGSNPQGTVLLSNNVLYGMCSGGGKYGDGTIYSVPL